MLLNLLNLHIGRIILDQNHIESVNHLKNPVILGNTLFKLISILMMLEVLSK